MYCTHTYEHAVPELKDCSHSCKHAVHAAPEHLYSNKTVLKLYLYCPCIVKNISCTCTETVLAHSIPCIKLYCAWPPVPILCAYIYCTYSACTCTYQGHMVCLCLFTYKSVKRHHIPVRQSLWNQTVLRKTPPIHSKYSISERAAEHLHLHLNERAAESLHLHLKWVELTKNKMWSIVSSSKSHSRKIIKN